MPVRSSRHADGTGDDPDFRHTKRRWPAEWERHRATWLSWPHNTGTWPTALDAVEDAFCEIVRAIAPGEAVEIHVLDATMATRVRKRLEGAGIGNLENVRTHLVPSDDAWIRDHGGVFIECFDGFEDSRSDAVAAEDRAIGTRVTQCLVDFDFNAWGGKYPPWDRDARVAAEMARLAGVPIVKAGFVLEAGAVDGDGEGTILTTESCLLNPNRRAKGPPRTRASLEADLERTLGAEQVLWLGQGIAGDDTDGHVDDLARFVAPGRVVAVVGRDRSDIDFPALADNRARLEGFSDATGRKLEIIELPTPGTISGPEGRLPASYANFYFSNRALLVPVFGVDADREALALFESLVRDREVIPIPSQNLVLGLGAVHCLTQQQPMCRAG